MLVLCLGVSITSWYDGGGAFDSVDDETKLINCINLVSYGLAVSFSTYRTRITNKSLEFLIVGDIIFLNGLALIDDYLRKSLGEQGRATMTNTLQILALSQLKISINRKTHDGQVRR